MAVCINGRREMHGGRSKQRIVPASPAGRFKRIASASPMLRIFANPNSIVTVGRMLIVCIGALTMRNEVCFITVHRFSGEARVKCIMYQCQCLSVSSLAVQRQKRSKRGYL